MLNDLLIMIMILMILYTKSSIDDKKDAKNDMDLLNIE